jgi:hypothetical protein
MKMTGTLDGILAIKCLTENSLAGDRFYHPASDFLSWRQMWLFDTFNVRLIHKLSITTLCTDH